MYSRVSVKRKEASRCGEPAGGSVDPSLAVSSI